MSHRIKEAAEGGRQEPETKHLWKDAIAWFYTIIFASLLAGVYISLDQHCTQVTKVSPELGHGICRVMPDWSKPNVDNKTR